MQRAPRNGAVDAPIAVTPTDHATRVYSPAGVGDAIIRMLPQVHQDTLGAAIQILSGISEGTSEHTYFKQNIWAREGCWPD